MVRNIGWCQFLDNSRPVRRLGLGLWLGSGPHVVGRLGSGPRVMGRLEVRSMGLWVSASFQIFALTAGGTS